MSSYNRCVKVISIGIYCVVFAASSGDSVAQPASVRDTKVNRQIVHLVNRIRKAKKDISAQEDSQRLMEVVARVDTATVDAKSLHEIASLMNTDDDGVRYWAAAAIGFFGPRARFAVPRLLEVLEETDCLVVDSPSALTIRPALIKIGVIPPNHGCTQFVFPKGALKSKTK